VIKGFREFIMRGNVVDLAVGVVIGAAFGAVVKSFTDNVLMAIVGAIFGTPNFGDKVLDLGDGKVLYGLFLNDLITFVLTAAAVYFAVVVPMNALAKRRASGEDDAEPTNEEKVIALLEQIAQK
jgi:large conductance mechanosensitive channel